MIPAVKLKEKTPLKSITSSVRYSKTEKHRKLPSAFIFPIKISRN